MDLKSRPVLPLEIVIEEISIEQCLNKPRNPCCKRVYQNDSKTISEYSEIHLSTIMFACLNLCSEDKIELVDILKGLHDHAGAFESCLSSKKHVNNGTNVSFNLKLTVCDKEACVPNHKPSSY